jgi:hypothetical protein
MSESEYKILVLADYDQKQMSGQLSSELLVPTPGNLKAEGVKICERRFNRKDEIILQSLFNQKEGAAGYRLAIQNCNAEIFKPVTTLIRQRNTNSTLKYLNLLAWLIDFQPRPYHSDLKIAAQPVIPPHQADIEESYTPGEEKEAGALNKGEPFEWKIQESATNRATTIGERQKNGPPVSPDKNIDRRWFIGIAVMLIGGALIWLILPKDNCMYWNNDHYVATSCDVPRLDTPLVRLDLAKLRAFRRIHHVDTLTYNSVGKLWYTRVADSLEVYSAGGMHPIYPDKKLKLLTYWAVNVCKKQHE